MNNILLALVSSLFAGVSFVAAAAVQVIDFDDPLLEGAFFLDADPVVSLPISIIPIGSNGAAQVINPPAVFLKGPHSGSAYLQSTLFSELEMVAAPGAIFDLNSLELAEFSSFVTTTSVEITGYFNNVIKASDSLDIDQFFDGPGGLADFQVINFDTRWQGLDRVVLNDVAFSIDNITITLPSVLVPIANPLFLLIAPLITLAGRSTRNS